MVRVFHRDGFGLKSKLRGEARNLRSVVVGHEEIAFAGSHRRK
jgi:hypothetical protein